MEAGSRSKRFPSLLSWLWEVENKRMLAALTLEDGIQSEVVSRFPGYCWGKIVALGLDNRSTPPEVTDQLRDAEARLCASWGGEVVAHPAIAAWRTAFTAFGARPSKYQSSIETLVRRVRRGDALPAINGLVDLYNAVSLRCLLPVGGDDLERTTGALTLRFARGHEDYVPLGEGRPESPEPGEVSYADAATVLCRRWCWRQGERTKITLSTRHAVLNVHGLPPATRDQVAEACAQLARLVTQLFGGVATWYVLDGAQPSRRTDLNALKAT